MSPTSAASLVIHPVSTTHGQLTAKAEGTTGVSQACIRPPVGIEKIADLLAGLKCRFTTRPPDSILR
ncbi:MAG: PLP-dependent transferase [Verrucomicrobiota bacterium]